MPKPHKYHVLILLAAAVLCFGLGAQYGRHLQRSEQDAAAALLTLLPQEEEAAATLPVTQEAQEPVLLAVHVKGAVERPGVYQLPQGSRVEAALIEAGLLETANTDIINLALPITDSMEIIIPFKVEGEETDWQALAESSAALSIISGGAVTEAASGIVNINSAGSQALQSLNGIGPAKAQAIIDYREQHGAFKRIEDIKKVSGIGDATYEKIKDRITVE